MLLIKKIFFSIKTIFVLVLVLIASIITATLLERTYGTPTATIFVYNAWWFEILWIWFSAALFVKVIHFELWQKKKWDMVLFPFAFVTILLGFILTKHFSIEGYLSLREGISSSEFLSSTSYLRVRASKDSVSVNKEYPIRLSPLGKPFIKEIKLDTIPISIHVKRHFVNAEKNIVADTEGIPVLEIAVLKNNYLSPVSCFLEKGEIDSLFGIYFGFKDNVRNRDAFIQFDDRGDEIWVSSNRPVVKREINSGKKLNLKPGVSTNLSNSYIYRIDSVSFVLSRYIPKGRILAVPRDVSQYDKGNSKTSEALELNIGIGSLQSSISLFSGKELQDNPKFIEHNGIEIEFRFGAKPYSLPFNIHLADFSIEHYKNSQEPSQFRSDVVIKDPEKNLRETYSIYMNHILRYRGYRIYQYSFNKDEKGSVFFVSRDPGSQVAYTGFFLLIGVVLLSLFHPKGRIRGLENGIKKFIHNNKKGEMLG